MKKKLLSIIALAMTMTMTTSAFAAISPRARGTGDVDGDGQITANDVLKILNGLADNDAEANVDGMDAIDGVDARVAYKTVLQPKNVTEDLVFNVYATEGFEANIKVLDADKLGSSVDTTGTKDETGKGMKTVDTTSVDASKAMTIKDAISEVVAAASIRNLGVTNQLNKIYFKNNVRGDVYLRSENGWSMLSYALQPIIPMDEATAALCNKTPSTPEELADPTLAARLEAFNKAKEIIVGANPSAPDEKNETVLTPEQIVQVKEYMFEAIPSGLDEATIKATAARVLEITDTKYDFTVSYNNASGDVTDTLKSADVDSSKFIADLCTLADYSTKTMGDYRNTFGDKVVFTSVNRTTGSTISAFLEVAETAK